MTWLRICSVESSSKWRLGTSTKTGGELNNARNWHNGRQWLHPNSLYLSCYLASGRKDFLIEFDWRLGNTRVKENTDIAGPVAPGRCLFLGNLETTGFDRCSQREANQWIQHHRETLIYATDYQSKFDWLLWKESTNQKIPRRTLYSKSSKIFAGTTNIVITEIGRIRFGFNISRLVLNRNLEDL